MAKPNLPIGHPCVWYDDLTGVGKPEMQRAAIVTRPDKEGLLGLHVFPPNAMAPLTKRGVRHCSDPWLREHPDVARQNGVWDFVEPIDNGWKRSAASLGAAKQKQTADSI